MNSPIIIGDASLYQGDCRDVLTGIAKVDAVIADVPYGTTRARWDAIIPFAEMWAALQQQIVGSTPILLFGAEPFSSSLRLSNIGQFRFDWVWEKPKATGFLNAKRQPMRAHELISVFSQKAPRYFPQMESGYPRKVSFRGKHLQTAVYGEMANDYLYDSTERYPRSVIVFPQDTQNSSVHDTQKPVGLMEYLVRSHTQVGDTVLDFTMGSGTTGIACMNTSRKFVGIESDPDIFATACDRIRLRSGALFAEQAA